jgi:SRSO17 transposase
MKKLYLLVLLLPISIFAKSYLISNIALPKTAILNLDPKPCNIECLETYLKEGFIFSFLAHADSKLEDSKLQKAKEEYLAIFNGQKIVSQKQDKVRIALLLPYKKITRYAASTTNASFAYLISKNYPFELKSFKIEDEGEKEISNALKKIQDDGFKYVIAPMTQDGEEVISKIDPKINIFFPTINKKDSKSNSKFLYYGGIDYSAQSDMLLEHSASPLVIFHDESDIGKQLSSYQEEAYRIKFLDSKSSNKVIKYTIPQRITNLEDKLKGNGRIQGSSIFINTPIVKSGMVLSQLTLYDTNPTNILSTQTNFNPFLLSMTQPRDRKNMIIANSITHNNDELIETNAFLSNDILYDWINYTTTIGVDYFSHLMNSQNREYSIEIQNNQMIYPIVLVKPSESKFIPYESGNE